ncbi:LytR/AlgR family response regulator transcription factor [Larkinella soli]|uniref:LytR/AlgR family response regulator transcription factor n=1 Tax=Larkinella soli TaxID=1770527 RepID=UPI000FFC55D4|nr:LytTR family DNA-binding domain-containing protein [Larkinella soli]
MKMRCLIVDDEPLAADLIASYMEKVPYLEPVGLCHSAEDAFQLLQRKPVDLLLLDIQMPRLTGLDLLRTLPQQPQVIITTAYREFALDGYELDVVDFLLKPILFERFLKAIGKAWQRRQTETMLPDKEGKSPSHLYVRVDREMVKVQLDEILWVESMKNYIKIRTAERQLVTYLKISSLEEKLPPDRFLRIHRSFLVAVDRVQAFNPTGVRIGRMELPIGRNYKGEVLRRLEQQGVPQ